MSLFFNFLFSKEETKPTHDKNKDPYMNDCDEENFYEQLYCDAMDGDKDAASEMEDEFGDDWDKDFE